MAAGAEAHPEQLALEEQPRAAVVTQGLAPTTPTAPSPARSGEQHRHDARAAGPAGAVDRARVGATSAVGSAGRVARRSSCARLQHGVHGAGEVVAPLGVGAVPVERRAAGRSSTASPGSAGGGRRRRRPRPSTRRSTTGRGPSKAAATSAAASPMATTARTRSATSASTERSRPLFRPPAISTTESKPRDGRSDRRGGWWPWSRRTTAPHQRRRPAPGGGGGRGTRRSAARTPSTVAPAASAAADGRQRVATSWGSDRGTASATATSGRRSGRRRAPSVDHGVVAGRGEPKRDHACRRARRLGQHDGVVGVDHGHVVGALVGPDAGLGGGVGVEVAVPVEVVGGEVEPHADHGPERVGELELERRHLDHDHVDVAAHGVASGRPMLPAATARSPDGAQHLGDQRGHRRLAVGAGDGDDRRGRPSAAASSNSLRTATPAAAAPARTRVVRRARPGWARPASAPPTSVGQRRRARAPRPARRRARRPRRRVSSPAWSSLATTSTPSPAQPARRRLAADAAARRPATGFVTGRDQRGRPDDEEVGVEDAEAPGRCTARRGSRSGRSRSSRASPELEVVVDRRHAEHPPAGRAGTRPPG